MKILFSRLQVGGDELEPAVTGGLLLPVLRGNLSKNSPAIIFSAGDGFLHELLEFPVPVFLSGDLSFQQIRLAGAKGTELIQPGQMFRREGFLFRELQFQQIFHCFPVALLRRFRKIDLHLIAAGDIGNIVKIEIPVIISPSDKVLCCGISLLRGFLNQKEPLPSFAVAFFCQ